MVSLDARLSTAGFSPEDLAQAKGDCRTRKAGLVEALINGRLGGAALDVYADEPNVPPELLALDNVVLLPHLASSTNETFAAMEDLVFTNLQQFFSNGTLLTLV